MAGMMRRWRRWRAEHREAPYVDALVNAILAGAAGRAPGADGITLGDVRQTAAVELVCALYSAAFGAADVAPPGPRTGAITPALLEDLVRKLIRHGEAVYLLDTSNGVELIPSSGWTVTGGYRPQSWRYRLDLPGPSDTGAHMVAPAASVVHVTYSTDHARPWQGVSPLDWASLSGQLAGNLERALADESAGTRGYVLPVPSGIAKAQADTIKADLRSLKGRTTIVESTSGGWGQGTAAAPARDWQPSRIGPAWPTSVNEARRAAEQSVLLACGVPLSLVEAGDAQGAREGWRRFLHGSLRPLARRVETELSMKLDAPVMLSFDGLFASDVQGRARAYQSLTGGGMAPDRAAVLAGLTE